MDIEAWLDRDVALLVLPIDKRRTGNELNGSNVGQRDRYDSAAARLPGLG
jgi:hypothetical protein